MMGLKILELLSYRAADPCEMNPIGCKGGDLDKSSIDKILDGVFIVIGIVAVFAIIYGAYNLMTSGGESGKIRLGKNAIMGAIIGLVIVVLARAIVGWIITQLS